MNWHLIGLVVMLGGLLAMWICVFVLVYLRGSIDSLDWTLAWLRWEKDPSPWAQEPGAAKISWQKVAPYFAIAVGATTLVVVTLLTGGK
jgi:hypothetical protein